MLPIGDITRGAVEMEKAMSFRTNPKSFITGRNNGLNMSKAEGDTVLLMGAWGSGATYNGQFETPLGEPAWNPPRKTLTPPEDF